MMLFHEFLLRAARNDDIPYIREIVFSCLREYGLKPDPTGKDKDLKDIEKSYFPGNGFFGVAVEFNTNKMVGTFGLFPMDKNICELRKIYLVKEVRGRGLGKYILDTAIHMAKERGYKKIYLETISPLKVAISLYKKYGFKEVTPKEINERADQAFELDIP
jgi:putative acetyltransferase